MKAMKLLPLLVVASLLSVGAQAANEAKVNCDAKIKNLEDIHKADGPGLHGGAAHDFQALLKEAKNFRAKGNMAKCQAEADRALTIYNKARGK
ncbi:hypothetical protein F3J44_00985 [Pantoea sp. Tr-811]|uniref:hypothetical protein n=1 Tax=unclassified Pantoea TaxID=2630326 RepID=UPI00142449FA|nr:MULTISPECIES: hypothetical protein [unclassified Pantoea]NIE75193.1 hypothetical protein [Pantoea sp. Ap-967]NIF24945.1 hypothetical protein [Pantoea sp. Tr-811]